MTTPSLTNPNPKREDEREARRSLSNSDRLRVATSYHREKLPAGFEKELLEFADEWDEELEAASARPSPGDPVRAALDWEDIWPIADEMERLETDLRTVESELTDAQGDAFSYLTLASGRIRNVMALTEGLIGRSKPAALSVSTPTGEGEVLDATPALHEDERDLTDEDRIAYWKGAYDRMAARNIELDTRLATLCEPSNPLLAQVLEAFNGAQEDVKNRLFYNSIDLFDALTRAKYAMTKHNEEATRDFADIAAERRRQTEAEKWTPLHDDEHDAGVLAAAEIEKIDRAANATATQVEL